METKIGENTHLNTSVFLSFGTELGPDAVRKSMSAGSMLSGTRPRRCAKTSSCIMDVLFHTYTFSMAIVGT